MSNQLWRRIGAFVLPMLTGNVLQLLAGTATAGMLGRLIGTHALASNGVVYPMMLICYSFAAGLTGGATILVANARGGHDDNRAKRVTLEALGLSTALGALFAAIGVFFGKPILHALGTPEVIFTQTLWYVRIVAASMIVFLPYMMYGALLRGLGDSKTPFYMLVVVTIASIAMTPLLILGIGAPRLGVLGAPLAPLIAIAVVTLAGVVAVPRMHPEFRLPKGGLRAIIPSRQTTHDILAIGVPIAGQYIAVSISELVLLSIINTSGASAVAVYAALNQIVAYVMTPMTMIGIAASAFAAKELGAGRLSEIPAIGRTAVGMTLALTGTMTIAVYVFCKPLLGLFLSDPAALHLAQQATYATLWSIPVLAVGTIATSLARSEKHAFGPMVANAIGVLLVLIPCAKVLVARHGIIGVWQAYPIAYVCIAIMEVAYFSYAWHRMRTYAQPQAAAV